MLDSHGIVVLNEKVWLVETQRPAKRTRAIGPMDLKPLGNPSLRVADSLETCHEPGPLLCLDVDIIQRVQNSFCFFGSGFGFFLAFFPGTICLVFATVWN